MDPLSVHNSDAEDTTVSNAVEPHNPNTSSDFDFTRSSQAPKWPTIREAPKSKSILVAESDDAEDARLMTFESHSMGSMINDIQEEFEWEADAKIFLTYRLTNQQNHTQSITVVSSGKNVASQLELMYSQLGQMDKVIVKMDAPKKPSREKTAC